MAFLRKKIPFGQDIWIHLLAVAIDILISLYASSKDPFGIMRFGINQDYLYWAYFVLIYVMLILCGLYHNRLVAYTKRKESEDFIKLSDLYTEGRVILDTISLDYSKVAGAELGPIIEKYKEWFQSTLAQYKKVDPVRANQWMVYDEQSDRYQSDHYSEDCRFLLNSIDGKLTKLNMDISLITKQNEKKD